MCLRKHLWYPIVQLAMVTLGDKKLKQSYLCHTAQGDKDKYNIQLGVIGARGFAKKLGQCKWPIGNDIQFAKHHYYIWLMQARTL